MLTSAQARGRVLAAAVGLTFALSGATGVAHASSTYSSVILGDSPSAYWRLGETSGTTCNDEVASSDGTYDTGTSLGATGAIANDANTAIGGNCTVPWTSDIEFESGQQLTIEAWAVDNGGPAFGVGGSALSASYELSFNGNGGIDMNFGGHCSASSDPDVITDDDYHYIVGVFDNGDVSLWIDGEYVGGGSDCHIWPAWPHDLTIGDGTAIDEAALYPYPLSDTQIADHYAAGISTP